MSVQKSEIFGWTMYDFANSAFATTILAVIFNQYFATVVAGGGKGVDLFGFRLHGASFFTFSVALSMAISAALAPLLGAVADASASKKRFLMVFCYIAILFTGLLYFVHAGNYWRGAIFFIIANIGFAGGNVYYNAFLPEISNDQKTVRLQVTSKGKSETLDCERILWVGDRQGEVKGLHLEKASLALKNGFVPVNLQMKTSSPGIYAVGDVVGRGCLAHKAFMEARIAVENILGKPAQIDDRLIPVCLYSNPEAASIGLTEEEAKKNGVIRLA
jgi:hypothetical protein